MTAADRNFWGVTFSHKPTQFFATLGTAGQTYLVEGDLVSKQLRVIADGVECPSLSPDDTRIAFKHKESIGFFGAADLEANRQRPLNGAEKAIARELERLKVERGLSKR